jgi:hypothetical protein
MEYDRWATFEFSPSLHRQRKFKNGTMMDRFPPKRLNLALQAAAPGVILG